MKDTFGGMIRNHFRTLASLRSVNRFPDVVNMVFDTCWLMDPRPKFVVNEGAINFRQDLSSLFPAGGKKPRISIRIGPLPRTQFKYIVPRQVKEEIARHLDKPESEANLLAAKKARLVCAELISRHGYQEVDLTDIPRYEGLYEILGPDSTVDKGIISLAVHLALEPSKVVYIATHDGGIQTEVSHLHNRGMKIYSPVTFYLFEKEIISLFDSFPGIFRVNRSNMSGTMT
jgi:hypothetical protein